MKAFVLDNGDGIRAEIVENISGSYSVLYNFKGTTKTSTHNYFNRDEAVEDALANIMIEEQVPR